MASTKRLSAPKTCAGGTITADFDGAKLSVQGNRTIPSISAFVPLAILIATRSGGGDVHIEGALSAVQLAKLNCEFAPFVADYFGGERCRVSADRLDADAVAVSESALMFSCGVDSFFSLKTLQSIGITPNILLNVHAGAHDSNHLTWRKRLDGVEAVGSKLNIQVETIETNFHTAFPAPHSRCHTIRNIAAALSLRNVSTLYYSAGYSLADFSYARAKAHTLAYIDPVIFRSILPAGFDAAYIGWEADRIDKTRAICDFPLAYDHLDVCTDQIYQAERSVSQPINCGRCNKCIRTLIEIEAFAALDRFPKAFDLSRWQSERRHAIPILAKSKDPIDQKAVKLLRSREGRKSFFSSFRGAQPKAT